MSRLLHPIFANSFDPDFLEKIEDPDADLGKAFSRDSMRLSEAVLTLRGYYPANWLEQIPRDKNLLHKLPDEWDMYTDAQEAIRGRVLSAFVEGATHYVKLLELAHWAYKKGFKIHPRVMSFIQVLIQPKKRGRPQDCSEIVQAVAEIFRSRGIRKITQTDLKNTEDPVLQALVKDYLKEASITLDGKTEYTRVKRRRKTLADNVNVFLHSIS